MAWTLQKLEKGTSSWFGGHASLLVLEGNPAGGCLLLLGQGRVARGTANLGHGLGSSLVGNGLIFLVIGPVWWCWGLVDVGLKLGLQKGLGKGLNGLGLYAHKNKT